MIPFIRYCLALSFLMSFYHTMQAAPLIKIEPHPILGVTLEPYVYGMQEKLWPSFGLNGGTSFTVNNRFSVWGALGMQTLPHLSPLPTQYQWERLQSGKQQREHTVSQAIDTSNVHLSTLHRGGGIRLRVLPEFLAGIYYYQDETGANYSHQHTLAEHNTHNLNDTDTTKIYKLFNKNCQVGLELLHPIVRFNLGWYFDTNGSPLGSTQHKEESLSANSPLPSHSYQASSELFIPLSGAFTTKVSLLSGKTQPFFSGYYIPCEANQQIVGFTAGCQHHLHSMLNTSFNIKYDTIKNWHISFTINGGWIGTHQSDTKYKGASYSLNQPFNRESMPFIFAESFYLKQHIRLDTQRQIFNLYSGRALQNLTSQELQKYLFQNHETIVAWLNNAQKSYKNGWMRLLAHAYPGNNDICYRLEEDDIKNLITTSKWPDNIQETLVDLSQALDAHAILLNSETVTQDQEIQAMPGTFPGRDEFESSDASSGTNTPIRHPSRDDTQSSYFSSPPPSYTFPPQPFTPSNRNVVGKEPAQPATVTRRKATKPSQQFAAQSSITASNSSIGENLATEDEGSSTASDDKRNDEAPSNKQSKSSIIASNLSTDEDSSEDEDSSTASDDEYNHEALSNKQSSRRANLGLSPTNSQQAPPSHLPILAKPPVQRVQTTPSRPSLSAASLTRQRRGTLNRITSAPVQQTPQTAIEVPEDFKEEETLSPSGQSEAPTSTDSIATQLIALETGQEVYTLKTRTNNKGKKEEKIITWIVLEQQQDTETGKLIATLKTTNKDKSYMLFQKNILSQYDRRGRLEKMVDYNKPGPDGIINVKSFYQARTSNGELIGKFNFRSGGDWQPVQKIR